MDSGLAQSPTCRLMPSEHEKLNSKLITSHKYDFPYFEYSTVVYYHIYIAVLGVVTSGDGMTQARQEILGPESLKP